MYVVIGSFSRELQMIYVAGAGTADVRGVSGICAHTTYELQIMYVVIGSLSRELQMMYVV